MATQHMRSTGRETELLPSADRSTSSRRGLDEQRPSSSAFFFDTLDRDNLHHVDSFSNFQEHREDDNDSAIFAMSQQIRQKLHTISSADMYAIPADADYDPDVRSGPYTNAAQEPIYGSMDPNYGTLTSRLSAAAIIDSDKPTPTSSSRASSMPPPSSDGRSSSEANDDELKTPPEPNYNNFASTHRLQLPRFDFHNAFSPYQLGNGSELELLDDGHVNPSSRGKGRMVDTDLSEPWQRQRPNSMTWTVSSSVAQTQQPFTRLGLHDIAFKATKIPERDFQPNEYIDIITRKFPSLCEPPSRELGEDGQPLPPTKKQEATRAEREARKASMTASLFGKQNLSLIKAVVVMEGRSASWKRIGNASSAATHVDDANRHGSSSVELPRLGPVPSPWAMEVRHEDLSATLLKGKNRKTLELASLRKHALCPKCDGQSMVCCVTCKGEKADECFWCSGTGREKARAKANCRRCQGVGTLKCNTCQGGLKSKCQTCEGQGNGEFGFFVDIKIKRIEMPAAPISSLLPQLEKSSGSPCLEEVKTAATMALWDSINKMTDIPSGSPKSKLKSMVPVMAGCVWESSISNIVAINIPLAARCKKGTSPSLRPEGLMRKIAVETKYFAIPSDADVDPVEISASEATRLGGQRTLPTSASTPLHKEFVARPSPLSQQVPASALASPRRDSFFEGERPTNIDLKARRPSSGQMFTSRLSANLLRSKLKRDSV